MVRSASSRVSNHVARKGAAIAIRRDRKCVQPSRLIAVTSLPAALMRAMASRVFSITVAM